MTQLTTQQPLVVGDIVQYNYTSHFTYKVERLIAANNGVEMYQIKPAVSSAPTYAKQEDLKKVRH